MKTIEGHDVKIFTDNIEDNALVLKATIELRKIKNLGILWIERNCKDLEWINIIDSKNNKF